MPQLPGMIKGLGVTFGEMVKTLKDGPQTVQYPHVKEEPAPRARGPMPRACRPKAPTRQRCG